MLPISCFYCSVVWVVLFCVLFGVLVYVLLWVGNRSVGRYLGLLPILFFLLCCFEWWVEHSFYVMSVGRQFVLIRVDGCEMCCGICGCRLSVYVNLYVCASSDDCEVEKIDVAIGF